MRFLIGLLFGIAIAVAVAYYLNKAPNPFVDKGFSSNNASNANSSAPLLLAPGTKMQVSPAQNSSANSDGRNNASAPSYDFYDVLQGNKNINDRREASAANTDKTQGFIIQLGSFVEPDLANNLKARMALLGYTVKIRQREERGKVYNKVLMGPFASQAQAQEILDQLKDQDIEGTIINLSN